MQRGDPPYDFQANSHPVSMFPSARKPDRAMVVDRVSARIIDNRQHGARAGFNCDGRAARCVPNGIFDQIAQSILDKGGFPSEATAAVIHEGDGVASCIDPWRERCDDSTTDLCCFKSFSA